MNIIEVQGFTVEYPGLIPHIITSAWVAKSSLSTSVQNPTPTETKALWDTGATNSVITQSIAKELNLIPTGAVRVNHAGGQSTRHTYIIDLYLPNKVVFCGVTVSECPDTIGNFNIIIGMDIITQGDFVITNFNRKTAVSFRYPSIEKIDFGKEKHSPSQGKVGRNAPCPCGKKKADGTPIKFKSCCGKI